MQKKLELLRKYKGYIICIIIILMASLSIFIQSRQKNERGNSNNNNNNSNNIGVYVTGEIVNPGVYYLNEGSRLYQLIDIAGGLSDTADINKLNLAQSLKDSDKIDIPKKGNKSEEEISNNNERDLDLDNNKVNINVATKEELMGLSGIGASTADKIIKYREKNTFTYIEDIMDVPGIGESKFNNIKDSISVD
mgnify:CR=1 FL=1